MNIFLAEITAWTGSAETTLRYSSGLGYTNGADWYAPRIENPATYAVSIQGAGYAAGSYGELTLINNDGALDGLADYAVDGRFLTLKYGDEAAAHGAFSTVLIAMMEGLSLERERVSIRLRDPAKLLDKPITTRVYSGAGGLDGDSALKDTAKPVVVGEAIMTKPVLIDAARLIYQIHDADVAAITRVLTQTGSAITPGGSFASRATLLSDAVTAGQYKTYTDENGTFIKLGSDPQGPIHVDVSEAIGLHVGTALARMLWLYGHVISPTLTTAGTAQAVATDGSTITLASGASAVDGTYELEYIRVIDGDQMQTRIIPDYVGSTKVATLFEPLQTPLADTMPDYEIAPGLLGATSERDAVDAGYVDVTTTGQVPEAMAQAYLIRLASTASGRPHAYEGSTITLTGGTGSGQSRTITYYLPYDTPIAKVSPNWTTLPDTTTTYSITEIEADQNHNSAIGYFTSSAANLKQAMDAIAASVHAWYGFDALNRLRMGLYRDPGTETSVATLTEDNFISLERVTDGNSETGLPNWRVTVTSGKRWQPLADNDAIPASLNALKSEWTTTSKQTDALVRKAHKLSAERSFESLMIDADGRRAEAMAADLLDLYKARHDTLTATIADPDLALTAIDIGQVVTVQVDRWGYTSGRKCRVVSLRRDYQRGLIDLTLWSAAP